MFSNLKPPEMPDKKATLDQFKSWAEKSTAFLRRCRKEDSKKTREIVEKADSMDSQHAVLMLKTKNLLKHQPR